MLHFFQLQSFLATSSLVKEEPMDTVIGGDEIMPENRSKESADCHEDLNMQNENSFAVG